MSTHSNALPFNSGIPTGPDVDRLIAKFGVPTAGTVMTYAEISAAIGEAKGTHRFNSVTNAWRKRLYNAHNVLLSAVAKVGYEALANTKRVTVATGKFKHGLRAVRRAATVAAKTDTDGLSTNDVRTRDHIIGVGAKLTLVAATEARSALRNGSKTAA